MARLLTEREQRFLRAYFGLDTGQPATLEAVGATEGLTRERARQVMTQSVGAKRYRGRDRQAAGRSGHRRVPRITLSYGVFIGQ